MSSFVGRAGRWAAQALSATKQAISGEILYAPKKRALWRFKDESDISRWDLLTDQKYGGFSTASFALGSENGTAKFSGDISLEMPDTMRRTGFAAIRSKEGEENLDLDDFNAVTVCMKTDGRVYTVSIKADGLVALDLYQYPVCIQPHVWTTVLIPFKSFQLTRMGEMQGVPRTFNPREVQHVGFSINDDAAGPFTLELKSIDAVRHEF